MSRSFKIASVILLLLILSMNIYILVVLKKSKNMTSEQFCNCFAAQYDGSEGDPNKKCYYGGYCYNKEKITKLYEDGAFLPTFDGV
jgi:hypothetical protein